MQEYTGTYERYNNEDMETIFFKKHIIFFSKYTDNNTCRR